MCLMPGTATRPALVTKGGAELVSSAITPRTISSQHVRQSQLHYTAVRGITPKTVFLNRDEPFIATTPLVYKNITTHLVMRH